MKITKISTNLIKPQTPTPQNLKNYHLSVVDQLIGSFHFGVILFYESKPENSKLQESLSKILVEFYPLAGRYIESDHLVDCSDEGAEFAVAEAPDVELLDLVANIGAGELHALLPEPFFRAGGAPGNPLLSVQATGFRCGGAAVAITVSHRVFDASSLGTFVAAWASYAANSNETTPALLEIPSLLPYKDLGRPVGFDSIDNHEETFVKRFFFDKGAIARLKSKIGSHNGRKTTSRVRVVCAVIARAMIGVDRAKHGRDRGFIITQGVNMRERTVPPVAKNSCGNFAVTSFVKRVAAPEDKGVELHELAKLIGDSARESIAECSEMLSPNGDGRDVIINHAKSLFREISDSRDTNVMAFTDWSRFGFYEADFGWGKPVSTSIGPIRHPFNSVNLLMSNKEGDGIEAWVHLNKNDMLCFEQDEDIKSYTS